MRIQGSHDVLSGGGTRVSGEHGGGGHAHVRLGVGVVDVGGAQPGERDRLGDDDLSGSSSVGTVAHPDAGVGYVGREHHPQRPGGVSRGQQPQGRPRRLGERDDPGSVAGKVERGFRRTVTRRMIREAGKVRSAGTQVTMVGPGRDDLEAIGANMMDPGRRQAVLETSLRTSVEALRRSRDDELSWSA